MEGEGMRTIKDFKQPRKLWTQGEPVPVYCQFQKSLIFFSKGGGIADVLASAGLLVSRFAPTIHSSSPFGSIPLCRVLDGL
ncbi:E3 Ubiquitin-Protein Ligase Marchf3 [Manis pentadactyla]|nr:E3 Ubiquitin-Protein Ligase Marchf3 [Manis pentadactyla]